MEVEKILDEYYKHLDKILVWNFSKDKYETFYRFMAVGKLFS